MGSMMSTMPRMVFDALNFGDLFDYPFYHTHSDGSCSKIYKRINEVQVTFHSKTTLVDFAVLESKAQANIVLGRSFFCSTGCFIDVKKAFICFRSPIKRKFYFPLKEKEVLIKVNVEIDFENT